MTYQIDQIELEEHLKELEEGLEAKAMLELGEDITFDKTLDPLERLRAMSEFISETL